MWASKSTRQRQGSVGISLKGRWVCWQCLIIIYCCWRVMWPIRSIDTSRLNMCNKGAKSLANKERGSSRNIPVAHYKLTIFVLSFRPNKRFPNHLYQKLLIQFFLSAVKTKVRPSYMQVFSRTLSITKHLKNCSALTFLKLSLESNRWAKLSFKPVFIRRKLKLFTGLCINTVLLGRLLCYSIKVMHLLGNLSLMFWIWSIS